MRRFCVVASWYVLSIATVICVAWFILDRFQLRELSSRERERDEFRATLRSVAADISLASHREDTQEGREEKRRTIEECNRRMGALREHAHMKYMERSGNQRAIGTMAIVLERSRSETVESSQLQARLKELAQLVASVPTSNPPEQLGRDVVFFSRSPRSWVYRLPGLDQLGL